MYDLPLRGASRLAISPCGKMVAVAGCAAVSASEDLYGKAPVEVSG